MELARVFISYSRKDGGDSFAANLRALLLEKGFSVWQDLVSLEGGYGWWSQIENAIRAPSLEHFVIVVTPNALANEIVRREIRLARQEGKTVSPVRGPGYEDLNELPRWIGQVFDLSLQDQKDRFLSTLASPGRQLRAPMMAPEPPSDFVERATQFSALKQRLLDARGDAVAISAALRGAGGYGKTTLAKALAHDEDVQDAYFDGILWVELGADPKNLLNTISDLVARLTGSPPGLSTIAAASAALGEALGNRRILLVVDDCWRHQDLLPFLQGGPKTTRLVTTRLASVLPDGTFGLPVDQMQEHEARALLSGGIPSSQLLDAAQQINDLCKRLGNWAQLLKMVNGVLRDRVLGGNQPLKEALADVNDLLDEEGLTAFDAENETDRTRVVALTVSLSLRLLHGEQRDRFSELAVFPEDAFVPLGVVSALWKSTGTLSYRATKDLLVKMKGLSLLLDLDLKSAGFRLHDTIREYLRNQLDKQELQSANGQIASTIESAIFSGGADEKTIEYYYLHLIYHLNAAGQYSEVQKKLLNPHWLLANFSATKNVQNLIGDFSRYGDGEAQNQIERTLRLVSGICTRDPSQLVPQLVGRLMNSGAPTVFSFVSSLKNMLPLPAIVPLQSSLAPPGDEIIRIDTGSGWVSGLARIPNGQLAVASGDGLVRFFHSQTGEETKRMKCHDAPIVGICTLADGRIATGSLDATVRIWDYESGIQDGCALQLSNAIAAFAQNDDGELAIGTTDGCVSIWETSSKKHLRTLVKSPAPVLSICSLRNGRLAVSFLDGSLVIFGESSGEEKIRLVGHSGPVNAICLLPDGNIATGSDDASIRIWDGESFDECAELAGHTYSVVSLAVTQEGNLASGSWDDHICIWDLASGREVSELVGHSGTVAALLTLPGHQLVSGSWDETIRIWDTRLFEKSHNPSHHADGVTALCVLDNGLLISGSADNTIKVFNPSTFEESGVLKKQSGWVTALCALPNNRFASAAWDRTIRIWSSKSLAEDHIFSGHDDRVTCLCPLSNGELASSSADNTVIVWDWENGDKLFDLKGHTDIVNCLAQTGDGVLVTASDDGTIRTWNIEKGVQLAELNTHPAKIVSICILDDQRIAAVSRGGELMVFSPGLKKVGNTVDTGITQVTGMKLWKGLVAVIGRDNSISLWGINNGQRVTSLNVDAPIDCLEVLPNGHIVVGDSLGRLHWLEVILDHA